MNVFLTLESTSIFLFILPFVILFTKNMSTDANFFKQQRCNRSSNKCIAFHYTYIGKIVPNSSQCFIDVHYNCCSVEYHPNKRLKEHTIPFNFLSKGNNY